MPRATAKTDTTERFDLRSCPGGFVVLRQMTYGQYLQRRDISAELKIQMDNKRGGEGDLKMMNMVTAEFEFKHCVVDHNLEDEGDNKLNFSVDAAVHSLDPKIGEEISVLIGKMNNFEEDSADFTKGSAQQSSSTSPTTPKSIES